MSKSKTANESEPVVIKKYANRRLYNTETSSYITLDLLSQMTREGREFTVVDAKTGEDITHNVLTQIIMEEEQRGKNMLPVNFLRQLIAMYGDSMQSMVPQYLEASMDAFRKNQQQFQEAMKGAFGGGPLADIAKRNMQMFEAAASAFGNGVPGMPGIPGIPGIPGMPGMTPPPVVTPAATDGSKDDEINDLKAQLAALNAKIDKLT